MDEGLDCQICRISYFFGHIYKQIFFFIFIKQLIYLNYNIVQIHYLFNKFEKIKAALKYDQMK